MMKAVIDYFLGLSIKFTILAIFNFHRSILAGKKAVRLFEQATADRLAAQTCYEEAVKVSWPFMRLPISRPIIKKASRILSKRKSTSTINSRGAYPMRIRCQSAK